ncbi:hypothetical protein CCP2SC5_440024 [Azospirillaceae bacterium]
MHFYEISAQLRHNGISDVWNGHPFIMEVIERRRHRGAMIQLACVVVGVATLALVVFGKF